MTKKQAKKIAQMYISCMGILGCFETEDLYLITSEQQELIEHEITKICVKIYEGEILNSTDKIVKHVLKLP